MRICAFTHCSNSTYRLNQWKKTRCEEHDQLTKSDCSCPAPFVLYPFPLEKTDAAIRSEWTKAVNRKDPSTGKNWQPSKYDRICSIHFFDGKRTAEHPSPCKNLIEGETEVVSAGRKRRLPPKPRQSTSICKRPTLEQSVDDVSDIGATSTSMDNNSADAVSQDHDYLYQCDCSAGCQCEGCIIKENTIQRLKFQSRMDKLKEQTLTKLNQKKGVKGSLTKRLLTSDSKVKLYTGLPNRETFHSLHSYLDARASKMRYWSGRKKSYNVKRSIHVKTPTKRGPKRKLATKDELLITLAKLRHGINNEVLADMCDISVGLISQIFNTWIKFLAVELQPIIFWPPKEQIRQASPVSLQAFPNLRCTLDCSEVFIHRPRNLEMQAQTWSEYKHHNTAKFLVGIAPNGMITFLSKAWGGRASDRLITKESGFLEKVEHGDLILADRGFTIREDLMIRGATLTIPPSSSGQEQMTASDVKATKHIANARIHVERAIGRMKHFAILRNVLPLALLPLIDDILTVCAAVCNLLPPLAK